MDKIIESIHIMNKLAKEIGYRVELIVDFNFPKQRLESITDKNLALLNSLFYMAIIDSISFLDEYQQVFGQKTERQFKERIIVVKAINKPFISKISEWKNLRDLRNHVLAHNLRVGKNGKFVFNITGLKYNAPRNFNDLFLLHNLISFATQTFNLEFEKELDANELKMADEIKETATNLTKEEVSKITVDLITKANKIKKEKNRHYEFSIPLSKNWDKI